MGYGKTGVGLTLPAKSESNILPLDGKQKLNQISFADESLANAAKWNYMRSVGECRPQRHLQQNRKVL